MLEANELSALLERIPDIVWRYRLQPDPGFDYVSASVFAITGYTPAEHYADPDLGRKIIHPDDAPLLEAVLRSEDGAPGLTMRWRHREGHLITTHQRFTFVRNDDGEVVAVEGVGRPLTEGSRGYRIRAGDVILDLAGHRALVGERVVELTPAEHRILAMLTASDGPVEVTALVERLWGAEEPGGARAIQVHISNLRRKIEDDPRNPTRLVTHRGIGYALAR